MGPAVVLDRVTLGYGKLGVAAPVLRDLTLALAAGQTHVWLGPSGCGKSTLLRSLMGLLVPTEGTIHVLERRVESATLRAQQLANRTLGFVAQDGGLLPHLTCAANVGVPATLAGWDAQRTHARIKELAAAVGLDQAVLQQRPHQVSGGQRQRVSLMRALLLDPQLLLLDEPFSALDPMIRGELQDELRALFLRLQKTVVLVTHDIAEAVHFADTLTVFAQGKVAAHGAPASVLGNPNHEWVQTFLRASLPKWQRVAEVTA